MGYDSVIAGLLAAAAAWAAAAAGSAVQSVINALGPSTEPDFSAIAMPYNRMLAIDDLQGP